MSPGHSETTLQDTFTTAAPRVLLISMHAFSSSHAHWGLPFDRGQAVGRGTSGNQERPAPQVTGPLVTTADTENRIRDMRWATADMGLPNPRATHQGREGRQARNQETKPGYRVLCNVL